MGEAYLNLDKERDMKDQELVSSLIRAWLMADSVGVPVTDSAESFPKCSIVIGSLEAMMKIPFTLLGASWRFLCKTLWIYISV